MTLHRGLDINATLFWALGALHGLHIVSDGIPVGVHQLMMEGRGEEDGQGKVLKERKGGGLTLQRLYGSLMAV